MLWSHSIPNNTNTIKDRYTEIQSLLLNCGKEGCLFLCLLSIIEEVNGEPIDIITVIKTSLKYKWIREDFFVNDSLSLLGFFTNKDWNRYEVTSLPRSVKPKEYTIAIYYNQRTGYTHFRRRGYDTLKDSVTVKEGYLRGYYIYEWS